MAESTLALESYQDLRATGRRYLVFKPQRRATWVPYFGISLPPGSAFGRDEHSPSIDIVQVPSSQIVPWIATDFKSC